MKKKENTRVDLDLVSVDLKKRLDEKAASLGLKTNAYLRMLIIQTLGGDKNE